MSKKLYALFALLITLAMLLGACGTTAEPAVEQATEAVAVATDAPVVTEAPAPTEPPAPTEVPLDLNAVFTDAFAKIAEKKLATVAAAKLSEELADQAPFLLDVRDLAEIEADGYIAGAVNVPIKDLLKNLDKLPGLDDPIVVYCASGHRGGIALSALTALGYTNVRNLGGGLGAWKKANLEVVMGAPAAAESINTPIVEDQALFTAFDEFLSGLPEGYLTIKGDALNEALASDKVPTIIDLRTVEEWNKDGYIEGAINIPFAEIMANLDKLPAKDQPIVILCASGHRGGLVLPALKMLGYEDVRNLGGGLNAWKAAKLPVAGWVDWTTVWTEYLTNLPEGFSTIKAADLNTQMAESAPFLLDVRDPAEIETNGFIAGAVNIPVKELLKNLDKLPALDQPIVIYCASGHRGGMAMAALQLLGYSNVKNLGGGLGAWLKAELPVEMGAPAAPVAGTAPEVDATRLRDLDAFFSNLPEGYYTVKAADLNTELASETKPVVVDLRTDEEWATGYIEGSVHIPVNALLADMTLLPADKAAPVVLTCASGHRGGIALVALRMLGWTEVRNLGGGIGAWAAAELPLVK